MTALGAVHLISGVIVKKIVFCSESDLSVLASSGSEMVYCSGGDDAGMKELGMHDTKEDCYIVAENDEDCYMHYGIVFALQENDPTDTLLAGTCLCAKEAPCTAWEETEQIFARYGSIH